MITVVILPVSDPVTHLVLEIANIVVLSLARLDVKAIAKVAVKVVVEEVLVVPVHLHPTIIHNNHFQVALIVLEVVRIVVPLDVEQHAQVIVVIIVLANVRQVVRTIVLSHVKAGVKANVLLLAMVNVKKVANLIVKQHVEGVKTHAWVNVKEGV